MLHPVSSRGTNPQIVMMTAPLFVVPPDPRVYFAAERTMLAWLRTGIAIMAFGFVVARFGLLLRLMRQQGSMPIPGHGLSPYLGAGLVALGVASIGVGAVGYRRYCARLHPSDLPSLRATIPPLLLSVALMAVGLMLIWTLLG